MPLGDERRAGEIRDGTPGIDREGPELKIEQEAEEVARDHSVGREHRDLDAAAARRQKPGAETDPRAGEHLIRHPRSDSPGDDRRRKQRGAPEREAEAGSENPAREDEHEEDGLDTGGSGAERA